MSDNARPQDVTLEAAIDQLPQAVSTTTQSANTTPDAAKDISDSVRLAIAQDNPIALASRYLEVPFQNVIQKYGGKNAGNELLRAIYGAKYPELRAIAQRAGFEDIRLPKAAYIETDVYREFERFFQDFRTWAEETSAKKSNTTYIHLLADACINENPEIRAFFERILDRIKAHLPDQEKAFVRGSLYSEDFLNDQYTGVSDSKNLKFYDEDHCLVRLCTMYMSILYAKTFPERETVPFKKDEALGLQVVPKIEWDFHVTSFCEQDGTVRIQIQSSAFFRNDMPIRFMYEVSPDNKITAYPNHNPEAFHVKKTEEYMDALTAKINGEAAPIPTEKIIAMAEIARVKRTEVGFQKTDTEMLIKDNILYDVQLRPAIKPFSDPDYKEDNEAVAGELLYETPFVLGKKFKKEGKLLKINDCFFARHALDQFLKENTPEDYILIVDGDDTTLIPFLCNLRRKTPKRFSGIVALEYSSALSHDVSTAGETYFLRQQNFLAAPTLTPKLKEHLSGEISVPYDEFINEEMTLKLPVSTDIFVISSDGKNGWVYKKELKLKT